MHTWVCVARPTTSPSHPRTHTRQWQTTHTHTHTRMAARHPAHHTHTRHNDRRRHSRHLRSQRRPAARLHACGCVCTHRRVIPCRRHTHVVQPPCTCVCGSVVRALRAVCWLYCDLRQACRHGADSECAVCCVCVSAWCGCQPLRCVYGPAWVALGPPALLGLFGEST